MDISSNIDQLIAQVEQLDDRSLETFLNKVNAIGTQRELAEGNQREKFLLKKIYEGFAPDKIQRIQLLQNKLQDGQILEVEYKELQKLLLQSSRHDISRLKLLIELSKLRNVTVPELMANLKLTEVPAQ